MNDTTVPIAQFAKNAKEEVRVSIDDYHGHKLINLRIYYRSADDEWKPGKQGLALSVNLYRDLADALAKVGEQLRSQGLIQ